MKNIPLNERICLNCERQNYCDQKGTHWFPNECVRWTDRYIMVRGSVHDGDNDIIDSLTGRA